MELALDPDSAMIAVRRTVDADARFRKARDTNTGLEAEFVPESGWVVPTAVTVTVVASSGGSTVEAATTSQWFIFGDIFKMYDKLIADLLTAIASSA